VTPTQALLRLCQDDWPELSWRETARLVVHARAPQRGLDVTVWRAIRGPRTTGYIRLRTSGPDWTWMEVAETAKERRAMMRRLRKACLEARLVVEVSQTSQRETLEVDAAPCRVTSSFDSFGGLGVDG